MVSMQQINLDLIGYVVLLDQVANPSVLLFLPLSILVPFLILYVELVNPNFTYCLLGVVP